MRWQPPTNVALPRAPPMLFPCCPPAVETSATASTGCMIRSLRVTSSGARGVSTPAAAPGQVPQPATAPVQWQQTHTPSCCSQHSTGRQHVALADSEQLGYETAECACRAMANMQRVGLQIHYVAADLPQQLASYRSFGRHRTVLYRVWGGSQQGGCCGDGRLG